MGIAYNGTYLAIAEGTGEKIYIWEGIPSKSDEPVKTLINPVGVGRLDMNQEWLVVAAYPGDQASVHVIKLDELFTGQLQPITNCLFLSAIPISITLSTPEVTSLKSP